MIKRFINYLYVFFNKSNLLKRNSNFKDLYKNNFLHLAVLENNTSLLQSSFDKKILHQANKFGLTPITLAQALNRKMFLKSFLENYKNNDSLEEFNVKYLPCLIFERISIFTEILHLCKKLDKKKMFSKEQKWLGSFFSKELDSAYFANVDIKSTNQNLGYGLFAKQNIAKNSFVGEFAGILKKRSSVSLKVNHYCLKYPIEGGFFQKYTIDASKKGNCFRFLNHNINPNLNVRSVFYNGFIRMIFLSLKDIKVGDQLTIDYGKDFWVR